VERPGEASIELEGRIVPYLLRPSRRSRGLRMTIDPRQGLIVSTPWPGRRGWPAGALIPRAEAFLRERHEWVLRHLDRLDRERAEQRARGGARDGGVVAYRGVPHLIRVLRAGPGIRRSSVERSGADGGDELLIRIAPRDRRPLERVLEAWVRERAREAIDRAVDQYEAALGVQPARVDLRDPRTRWGSAARTGRLMFSWRLVLAPPAALETVVVHELAHLKVFGHGPRFWALVAAQRPSHLADRAWLRRHAAELHAALEPDEQIAALG
jgi:predicted metal-dependent hydrolase